MCNEYFLKWSERPLYSSPVTAIVNQPILQLLANLKNRTFSVSSIKIIETNSLIFVYFNWIFYIVTNKDKKSLTKLRKAKRMVPRFQSGGEGGMTEVEWGVGARVGARWLWTKQWTTQLSYKPQACSVCWSEPSTWPLKISRTSLSADSSMLKCRLKHYKLKLLKETQGRSHTQCILMSLRLTSLLYDIARCSLVTI